MADPPEVPEGQPSTIAQLPLKRKAHDEKTYQLWTQHPDNRMLWDVVLKCDGDVTIHATCTHLAAWSEYFERLFLGSFKDSSTKEIVLEGICGRSLKRIIEGLYCPCGIVFCIDDVASVLVAADRLRFVDVVEQCEVYMTKNINDATAALFYKLGDKHSLHELKQVAEHHLQHHLPSVVQHDIGGLHFAALGKKCMMQFLTTCNTEWRRGVHLLQLFDELGRAGISRKKLIDCIDVEKCSIQELIEIRDHPVVSGSSTHFMGRIASTALSYLEYLSRTTARAFLPTCGLHLVGSEYKLAVCWHIRNWAATARKQFLYSPDFVIPGKGSWKLLLYPNGNFTGKGSHMSLYLRRAGEFSGAMEMKFAVSMLNCSVGSHLPDRMKGPVSHSFPESQDDWGWREDEFIALDAFNLQSDTWIQDDTIVLAVIYKP